MMKPLNVRNTYPVLFDYLDVTLPDHFADKSTIIVFNIEAEKGGDFMYRDMDRQIKFFESIKEAMLAAPEEMTAFVIRLLEADEIYLTSRIKPDNHLFDRIHIVVVQPEQIHRRIRIVPNTTGSGSSS